jgi:hypothetical protein
MKPILVGLVMAACALTPAFAQTVQDIDARQQAVVEAWEKTPLSIRRIFFVTEKASMYGAYSERKTNKFRAGEPLITYVEPVGYTWKPVADNAFQFGVIVDFSVKTASGQVLGGQDSLLHYNVVNRERVQEFMLNTTINLNGVKPGDYILTLTIHDVNDPSRTTKMDQPFTIVG